MAQQFGALAGLAENQSQVPNTHVRQLQTGLTVHHYSTTSTRKPSTSPAVSAPAPASSYLRCQVPLALV